MVAVAEDGSVAVPLEQELERVMPIVEALRDCGKPLSIDTYKPEVMRATLAAGVDLVNDIWGFRRPGAVEAVTRADAGLVPDGPPPAVPPEQEAR